MGLGFGRAFFVGAVAVMASKKRPRTESGVGWYREWFRYLISTIRCD